ncbi:hypothetical protein B0H19DRAFT_1262696 [Mycena capillaripes]|nr:hypothetical protein B0H19DRAFT_1262696 [Mycena capillaripes]
MEPPITTLSLVPVELWLACWTLCSRRQLRRISLVCKLFRSVALPLLLQHQTFNVAALASGITRNNWTDHVRHLHRTAIRLDRLCEGPSSLVRSWKVTFNYCDRIAGYHWHPEIPNIQHPEIQNIHLFDLMNERVVATFSATLRLYQNLCSLHLGYVSIDASFRKTLASLPRLSDLGLSSCKITTLEGFLGLRRLGMSGGYQRKNKQPLQIASPDTLHSLDAGEFIMRLIPGFQGRTLDHLVHLSIQRVHSLDLLFPFFGQCPRLESLVINAVDVNTTPPTLHPNTIRNLRVLTGPPTVHKLLATDRPLSSAVVLDERGVERQEPEYVLRVCLDISRSSAPLRCLTLPRTAPTLEFLVSVCALFPDLRELTLTVYHGRIFVCGGWGCVEAGVEQRCPDLSDDTAFDDLPMEDISDGETDKPRPTIAVSKAPDTKIPGKTSGKPKDFVMEVSNIFDCMLDGELSLPPNIEILRLETEEGLGVLFEIEQQHKAIAGLTSLYSRLREVQFGSLSHNWKRDIDGELWKSGGDKSWIRVVSVVTQLRL